MRMITIVATIIKTNLDGKIIISIMKKKMHIEEVAISPPRMVRSYLVYLIKISKVGILQKKQSMSSLGTFQM